MKDNDGGFNCGKPAGYQRLRTATLPDSMKDLIRSIKRVRALFGTVELVNPTDAQGNPVDVDTTPFIWEIDNRDAFKTWVMFQLSWSRCDAFHHSTTFMCTQKRDLPNGSSFYVPTADLDLGTTLDMDNDTQEVFANFMAWIAELQYVHLE